MNKLCKEASFWSKTENIIYQHKINQFIQYNFALCVNFQCQFTGDCIAVKYDFIQPDDLYFYQNIKIRSLV